MRFSLVFLLIFSDFLVTFGLAKKVRLRVKSIPWFVSDTTPQDIDWLLSKLIDGAENPLSGDGKCDVMRSGESDRRIGALGLRWREFLDSKLWSVHPDPFWTYPHDFRYALFLKTLNRSTHLQIRHKTTFAGQAIIMGNYLM